MIINGFSEARRHRATLGPVATPGLDRPTADMAIDEGARNQCCLIAPRPRHLIIVDGSFIMRRVVEQDMHVIVPRKGRSHGHAPSRGSVAIASLASMAAMTDGGIFKIFSRT